MYKYIAAAHITSPEQHARAVASYKFDTVKYFNSPTNKAPCISSKMRYFDSPDAPKLISFIKQKITWKKLARRRHYLKSIKSIIINYDQFSYELLKPYKDKISLLDHCVVFLIKMYVDPISNELWTYQNLHIINLYEDTNFVGIEFKY